jgi:hypothetical protein
MPNCEGRAGHTREQMQEYEEREAEVSMADCNKSLTYPCPSLQQDLAQCWELVPAELDQ